MEINEQKNRDQNEDCPIFNKLMSRLNETLKLESNEELEQKEHELELVRKAYLREKTKLEVLHQFILYHEIESPPNSNVSKLVRTLRDELSLAEVQGFLDLGEIEGEKVTTLGLSRTKSNSKVDVIIKQLLPQLEDFLFNGCAAVLAMTVPTFMNESNRSILHPHLVRLPDKIDEILWEEQQLKTEHEELLNAWEQTYLRQLSLLSKIADNMDQIVNKFYTSTMFTASSTQVQYELAKCESLKLKLNCLEVEILNLTYNKDSLKAIRNVKERLTALLTEAEARLESYNTTLAQYERAGPEFRDIVREYAELQKEIEGKQWALKELGESPALP